jgi:putative sterol carrier protein
MANTMSSQTQEIFERLGGAGYVPRLHGTTATVRYDIVGAGSWHVAIDDGSVTVTESNAPADCVLELEEETFQRITSGQMKPIIAFMQGLMTLEGEPATALKVAGLFAAMAPAHA